MVLQFPDLSAGLRFWVRVWVGGFCAFSNHNFFGRNKKKVPKTNGFRNFCGIPTVRGYNAPCFEGMVHYFMGSILMHRDNEDRKDKMRNALPEVFSLPCRKLSVGRLYLGCFLKMYGSKAPKRTRAFLTHACVFVILLCDTWLPHLFHPKTVAPRFLAFAEFCMLEGVSHVEAPPHLRV